MMALPYMPLVRQPLEPISTIQTAAMSLSFSEQTPTHISHLTIAPSIQREKC